MTASKTTKPVKSKRKKGRPTLYSKELAEKIIALIEQGYSERKISKMEGMPDASTILRWKDEHEDFCRQSARAREVSASLYREEALKIAEEINVFADAVEESHRRAFDKDKNNPDRDDNGNVKKTPRLDIPMGWVEAKKVVLQELNREAALRDDSRFGDRKKVQMTGKDDGPIEIKQEVDLANVTTENLKAVRELLYGTKTADTD